ncbi:methyltransferase domain-containing protein [bacterium]|nr:methyltransferase domain-containing protein [bacterium]
MAEGLAARRAALALLAGVMVKGLSLAEQGDAPLAGLAPGDRARAQRLALAVMRRAEPIDRLLGTFLHKKPPLPALNILRLAVVELAEGSAAHGVVNSAVELARRDRETSGLAGMINAVLRKLVPPIEIGGPAQRLPGWLRQALVARYGKVAVARMEEVQAGTPPVDITLKAGATAPEGADVLPTGSLRLGGGQVSALPGFAEGDFWVQDAAAALAVRLLGDVRGLRVLDLCAAPGGKTLQLADGGAEVTALDISGPRLGRLRENLARTGLQARIVTADALQWQPDAPFDAVLLDAPCSATGTIRRHPDLPFLRQPGEIAGLVDLQARLLDRALGFVKPGGRLVYCTCSLLQDEGEAQVAAALARHPELMLLKPDLAGVEPAWMTDRGLRLRPDYWAERGGMDGFYMALLQLPG